MFPLAWLLASFIGDATAAPSGGFSPSSLEGLGLMSPALNRRTSCGTSGPASCHNTTKETNTCCFESPGGLITQVQFWDTNPPTGPVNSWTIHGLWPDHCDGTYSENCDSSRDYTDIGTILSNAGRSDLVDFMNDYWLSNDESPEAFWEHEWSTHGTCYSTLAPACFPSGTTKGTDAVDFFSQVITLFKSLPTYEWLENEGITPSSSQTWTLSQITSALKSQSGYLPALDCTSGAISEIYWYYNLKGSLIDGEFVPIDAPSAGSCSSSAKLKYPPKSSGTTAPAPGGPSPTSSKKTTTPPGGGSGPTPTTTPTGSAPGSLPTKAYLDATSGTGCLLSLGTWSTQTCATYTISGSPSAFTMKTSKGSCGVSGGTFSCGSGVSASTFGSISSGGSILLTYGGSSSFSASGTPSGSTVETVLTDDSGDVSLSFSIDST